MKKQSLVTAIGLLAIVSLLSGAMAQPYVYPAEYAATATQGGTINEDLFGDFKTLNPVLSAEAGESSVLGMASGPGLVSRDWLGNRSFRDEDGNWNLFWASNVDEVVPDQEFVVTVRQGWKWSDGTEMTVDDAIAAATIIADKDVQSNSFSCAYVDTDPIKYEKIDTYSYRITLPRPVVNSLAVKDCGTIPAHIFMPVYEAEGAAGVRALWGVDTPVSELVSGGAYVISEFRPGERVVLTKNPGYGAFVQAADGSPLPGPDRWVVTFSEDQNAILSRVVTGQTDFYYPTTLDQVRAIREAIDGGSIQGTLYANLGQGTLVDFMTYNFNKTNECKRDMFRNPAFRTAISSMIDRDALVQGALGGLGSPAKDWQSEAAAPFDAPELPPFEFDPEQGTELLASIGFTDLGPDGVLFNPNTGCRVEFDLQYNSGNNRRAQEAAIISQTVANYGVKVNPREVASAIWADAIQGSTGDFDPAVGRAVDYDAQIWGLAGGDIDNPSAENVFGVGVILNAWNKSTTDVASWEVLMDRLSQDMISQLDLDKRVAIYDERADLMRHYLPLTPLIATSFNFFNHLGNVWPKDKLDANSIESPYRPGAYRELITVAQ